MTSLVVSREARARRATDKEYAIICWGWGKEMAGIHIPSWDPEASLTTFCACPFLELLCATGCCLGFGGGGLV